MSGRSLNSYSEAGAYTASELTASLMAGTLDWAGMLTLCEAYRQLGLCHFFLHRDNSVYFNCMCKSAGAFHHFLRTRKDEGIALSAAEPLIDCINGGFWLQAKKLMDQCPREVNSDYEYPEKFYYLQFLLRFAFGNSADSTASLEALAEVAVDDDEVRVEICTALLDGNANDFHDNLCVLLDIRSQGVEAKIARGALTDAQWAWRRFFSNEGLLLLRIAQQKQIPFDSYYLHVPEELLTVPGVQFSPDAWRAA